MAKSCRELYPHSSIELQITESEMLRPLQWIDLDIQADSIANPDSELMRPPPPPPPARPQQKQQTAAEGILRLIGPHVNSKAKKPAMPTQVRTLSLTGPLYSYSRILIFLGPP